jgi:hypothetical protein
MIVIDMIRNKRIVLCHVEPFIIHVYFFFCCTMDSAKVFDGLYMLHMDLIFPWNFMVFFIYLVSNYSSVIHEADIL